MLETIHVGSHALLPYVYNTLLSEVARRGVEAVGPVREIYLAARTEPPGVGLPVTRLLVPISQPAGSPTDRPANRKEGWPEG
jgi:hypothetical protein